MYKIAVLMTCYNRKKTTLKCLKTLFDQDFLDNLKLEVFLVDDASPDGTGSAVCETFPKVHVIKGTGDLYWGGGMRLAWECAAKHANYDFFLWLNDDVEIFQNAIKILLADWEQILKDTKKEALISGCVRSPSTGKTSYSGNNGNNGKGVVNPSGLPQEVAHNNGNIVFISKKIYNAVGNISKKFPHQLGDGDYGLRAQKNGFGCYVSSEFVGYCEYNNKLMWDDPSIPLLKRLRLLHAPTGMPPKDRFVFEYYHGNILKAFLVIIKLYARVLFPRTYSTAKNTLSK